MSIRVTSLRKQYRVNAQLDTSSTDDDHRLLETVNALVCLRDWTRVKNAH